MQIQVKSIIRPLDLGDYAKELQGQAVQVWVNPSREMLGRRSQLEDELRTRADEAKTAEAAQAMEVYVREVFEPGLRQWFADLWSQHPDPATRWTMAEIIELEQQDPALIVWLNTRSMQMILEHRRVEKKS